MNYSHDNWSAILAHIGKPEELDTSARNAGALTRRREIRDAATLLRLGLAYGPGGMSLREVTAWAQLHDVATLSWDLRAPAPTPSHLRATVAIKGSFRGAEF